MTATRDSVAEEAPVREGTAKRGFLYPGMVLPFCLLVSCFAAWGMAGDMTAPLVKVFRSVFSMNNAQSSLVQSAYYGAYFCLAIPAAFINSRLGYKGGVLIGLGLAAAGGLLFIPASHVMTYSMFLAALFTLASGLSILETSANPFVMSMGPEHNATRRLNFAQAFNPIGSNLGVLIATTLILPYVNPATAEQRASMSEAELLSTRSSVKVPEAPVATSGQTASSGGRLARLLGNKRYSFGVVAQFFNIAAQTCIWTFTLHYVTDALGVSDKVAGYWLQASLIVFLVFRFLMVGLMGRFDARKLMIVMCLFGVGLSLFAMVSVNIAGAVAVAMMSASISLLFPTIYGEALKGLGEDTKFGAAGLVMAIIGGATMPLVQGWIMDRTSASFSYVTVGVCLSIVAAYGFYTLRADREDAATVAVSGT